jgi:4-hydroxy-4-methyl-2-oxoglutarate aldolase
LCAAGDNLAVHRAIEAAPRDSVLVVQAHGQLKGYWGEVLSRAAMARGINGLVIDGGVRDVDALEALGFPAFARGISVLGTAKASAGSIGEPVQVGGVNVGVGSLIIADRDGVVCLPAPDMARTLRASRERRRQENDHIRKIQAGELTLDIYGWRHLLHTPSSPHADGRLANEQERQQT